MSRIAKQNKSLKRKMQRKSIRNIFIISITMLLAYFYLRFSWHKNKNILNMLPDIFLMGITLSLATALWVLYKKYHKLSTDHWREINSLIDIPGMTYRAKLDENWTMTSVSEGSYQLTGYTPEELLENDKVTYGKLVSSGYQRLVYSEWDRIVEQEKVYFDEYEIIDKNGEHRWVLEIGSGIYDKERNPIGIKGIVFDVTNKKMKEHQIKKLNNFDFLTGLYNHNYMRKEQKRLNHEEFFPLSVFVCDINGLGIINDAYGYEEGDRLISQTGEMIKQHLNEEAVLGYTGDGSFLVYLPNTSAKESKMIRNNIQNALLEYNNFLSEESYPISFTIACGTKEKAEEDLGEIIRTIEKKLNRRKLLNKKSSHSGVVSSIMASLYAKSNETEEHGQRLEKYCSVIGKELGFSLEEIDELRLLAKLHDIGKIGIDEQILEKPGELTSAEWVKMKQHTEIGYDIVSMIPQLAHIAEGVLYHHERWDGTGYPEQLKGEEIPLNARIISLADAYDAMTKDRVYRKALSKETAIKEIQKNAGKQFDPEIAEIFINLLENQESI